MTAPRVRLFIAAELPSAFREDIARVGASALAMGIGGVRPVRAENAHLTLKFLGEVGADRVEDVLASMRLAAARAAPFSLRSGNLGAFPNADAPRVLWLGVDGDLVALRRLRDYLEDALAAAGFQRDRRGFAPHVTAARVRDRVSPAAAKRLMNAAAATVRPTPVEFAVKRLSLMRSDARPAGAVYTRLGEAELGRAPSQARCRLGRADAMKI